MNEKAEAGGAVGEREEPLTMDRAAVYVALAHLGRWVMRWRWWDDSKEDWVETDSADFGDAIADQYDATMVARLSVNEGGVAPDIHQHDPFMADRCSGCAALAGVAPVEPQEPR